jgi:hypothetical protein
MEDDSWARAPVPETGLLVSAEVKRRTTVGSSMLFTPQTGLLLSAETKRHIYHGRWRAPHVVVHLLRTWRPTPEEYDSWARAPVPEAGSPRCTFLRHFGALVGESFFKKGIPLSVVAILITRSTLSLLSSPRSSATVAAMALLNPPERLQPEVALNLVRNLLGWGAPTFVGRICVGASTHGELTAGEFMLFVSDLPSGLALPISSFFVLLLEELGLQPQHITPCSILQATIIAYLHRMSVGATLLTASSSSIRGEGCSLAS